MRQVSYDEPDGCQRPSGFKFILLVVVQQGKQVDVIHNEKVN